jgi:hypothetical protein
MGPRNLRWCRNYNAALYCQQSMQVPNTVTYIIKVGLPNFSEKCLPNPAQIDYLNALNTNTVSRDSCMKYKLYRLCVYVCVCVYIYIYLFIYLFHIHRSLHMI